MTEQPGLPCLSRCERCDGVTFPAKQVCPYCGNRALVETAIPEEGDVFSYTTIPQAGGGERRIALVNAGGVRLLMAIPGEIGALGVGDKVRIRPRAEPPGYEAAPWEPAVPGVSSGRAR